MIRDIEREAKDKLASEQREFSRVRESLKKLMDSN